MITFSYGGGGDLRKIKAYYLHKEVSLEKKLLKVKVIWKLFEIRWITFSRNGKGLFYRNIVNVAKMSDLF